MLNKKKLQCIYKLIYLCKLMYNIIYTNQYEIFTIHTYLNKLYIFRYCKLLLNIYCLIRRLYNILIIRIFVINLLLNFGIKRIKILYTKIPEKFTIVINNISYIDFSLFFPFLFLISYAE